MSLQMHLVQRCGCSFAPVVVTKVTGVEVLGGTV